MLKLISVHCIWTGILVIHYLNVLKELINAYLKIDLLITYKDQIEHTHIHTPK